MREREPSISINASTIAAKDAEREALAAQLAAFQAKRGNRIQVLPTRLGLRPEPTYRQLNDAMAASNLAAAKKRRGRTAADP